MGRLDRRHGPDMVSLPIAISIPDLIQQVAKKHPIESPIPSEPFAKHDNCRFDVKYKVLSPQRIDA